MIYHRLRRKKRGAAPPHLKSRDDRLGIVVTTPEDPVDIRDAAVASGVGLRIVERIADAHGWSVRAVEGADGGARFEFSGADFEE